MSPAEVLQQRHAALKVANKTRLEGVAVKREIFAGTLTASSALSDPRAQVMRLDDLLACQRRWGAVKTQRFMREMGIRSGRRLRELTERQKWLICEALEDR